MSNKFKRKIEDFSCENCNSFVKGDGYTNHCPECLWSKHVDRYPGDRAETCGGLMKPSGVLKQGSEYRIFHQCQKCGQETKVKMSDKDEFESVLRIP